MNTIQKSDILNQIGKTSAPTDWFTVKQEQIERQQRCSHDEQMKRCHDLPGPGKKRGEEYPWQSHQPEHDRRIGKYEGQIESQKELPGITETRQHEMAHKRRKQVLQVRRSHKKRESDFDGQGCQKNR